MQGTDTIADMLTQIRNALAAKLPTVEIPHSRVKAEIARILKREGYIEDFATEGSTKKTIRMGLKYTVGGDPAIRGLRRVSLPGHRRYVALDAIPRVLGGMGVAVLSTSKGIMTGKEARKQQVGGEVICSIW
jgi:small subunit ribosomal protein S8